MSAWIFIWDFFVIVFQNHLLVGMAEWTKVPDSRGRNVSFDAFLSSQAELSGYVGSNPTSDKFFCIKLIDWFLAKVWKYPNSFLFSLIIITNQTSWNWFYKPTWKSKPQHIPQSAYLALWYEVVVLDVFWQEALFWNRIHM